MLKLTLIKAGIKTIFKNTRYGVVVFIIGFVAFLFIKEKLDHRAIVQELEAQKTNLQEIAFLEAKKDSTASVALAQENAKLRGLYQSQTRYTLEWKEKAMDLQAKQEILPEGRIKVGFKKDTECLFLQGYTLTETAQDSAEAKLTELGIKPIEILNSYMTVGDSLYSILKPSNPCFRIKNHTSLIPPEYLNPRSRGIPWRWILPSAVVGFGICWVSN